MSANSLCSDNIKAEDILIYIDEAEKYVMDLVDLVLHLNNENSIKTNEIKKLTNGLKARGIELDSMGKSSIFGHSVKASSLHEQNILSPLQVIANNCLPPQLTSKTPGGATTLQFYSPKSSQLANTFPGLSAGNILTKDSLEALISTPQKATKISNEFGIIGETLKMPTSTDNTYSDEENQIINSDSFLRHEAKVSENMPIDSLKNQYSQIPMQAEKLKVQNSIAEDNEDYNSKTKQDISFELINLTIPEQSTSPTSIAEVASNAKPKTSCGKVSKRQAEVTAKKLKLHFPPNLQNKFYTKNYLANNQCLQKEEKSKSREQQKVESLVATNTGCQLSESSLQKASKSKLENKTKTYDVNYSLSIIDYKGNTATELDFDKYYELKLKAIEEENCFLMSHEEQDIEIKWKYVSNKIKFKLLQVEKKQFQERLNAISTKKNSYQTYFMFLFEYSIILSKGQKARSETEFKELYYENICQHLCLNKELAAWINRRSKSLSRTKVRLAKRKDGQYVECLYIFGKRDYTQVFFHHSVLVKAFSETLKSLMLQKEMPFAETIDKICCGVLPAFNESDIELTLKTQMSNIYQNSLSVTETPKIASLNLFTYTFAHLFSDE